MGVGRSGRTRRTTEYLNVFTRIVSKLRPRTMYGVGSRSLCRHLFCLFLEKGLNRMQDYSPSSVCFVSFYIRYNYLYSRYLSLFRPLPHPSTTTDEGDGSPENGSIGEKDGRGTAVTVEEVPRKNSCPSGHGTPFLHGSCRLGWRMRGDLGKKGGHGGVSPRCTSLPSFTLWRNTYFG